MRACKLGDKGALFESKSIESTNARARERVDGRGGGATRDLSGWVLASRQAVHVRRSDHKLWKRTCTLCVVNRRED